MSRRAAAPTMPHMDLGLLPGLGLPARDRHLARARHGELPGGRVLADGGSRADIGAARDAHRRDQRRVRADEALVLDHGAVLRYAVVVAGDRSRADVDARAHLGVADVGEMVGLGAGADTARLDLDEVADVHVLGEARAGAQPRIGTDAAVRADLRGLELRERGDHGVRPERDVTQYAVRPDAHPVAEADFALEHAVDVDRDVAPALEQAAHVDARRI